jgi:proline dehydrogenase/carbapenem biosynthesis protein (putative proline dehydrogenase)
MKIPLPENKVYRRYSLAELCFKYLVTRLITSRLFGGCVLKSSQWLIAQDLFFTKALRRYTNKIYFGGENFEQVQKTVQHLAKDNIKSVLDYAIEGNHSTSQFQGVFEHTSRMIEQSKGNPDIAFVVVKPSSIGSREEYNQVSMATSSGYIQVPEQLLYRYTELVHQAQASNVVLVIDAEQSWLQQGVDLLALKLMQAFNRDKICVFTTVQMYLRSSLSTLNCFVSCARRDGFLLGVKLVRGAYLESENEYAKAHQKSSLCFGSKRETDEAYDKALDLLAEQPDLASCIVATHNKESLEKAVAFKHSNPQVRWSFCQLYGIGDHLTYQLEARRQEVSKYVPFGPLECSIPYLSRRLEENKTFTSTLRQELDLIESEIVQRIGLKRFIPASQNTTQLEIRNTNK